MVSRCGASPEGNLRLFESSRYGRYIAPAFRTGHDSTKIRLRRALAGQAGGMIYSVMTLAANEEHLVEALRALPPSVADQVITWLSRLYDLGKGGNVDWSDTWNEEDLMDARRASSLVLEER